MLIVGLALHNLVMAELWGAGLRGGGLDVVAAWKDVLLAVALGVALLATRRLPLGTIVDRLALAFAAAIVIYALLPQSWLDGEATAHARLLALRHDLLPVGAYFLGRALAASRGDRRRLSVVVIVTACVVAAFGLLDAYAVSLQWWRDSGAPGWFREQLGLRYEGLSGLPENFVYNTGDERPLRRLVSTFLSPLATSFLLVVALICLAARRWARPWLAAGAAGLVFAALLFTHSRSSILALAGGLVVLAVAQRRWWLIGAAGAVAVAGAIFVHVYPDIGPRTTFTPSELAYQRQHARAQGEEDSGPLTAGDSSTESHWRNLRDGTETVLRHPQGYGLGNAGVTAFRSGKTPKAGESTYTELGVEAGLAGALLFVAWNLALLARLWRPEPWLAAALAAVLVLGLQTDVIGVPWLAVVLWGLCGAAVADERDTVPA